MTPDTLTQARAEEAVRRAQSRTSIGVPMEAARVAIELERANWTPPLVDPDLLEAREIIADLFKDGATKIVVRSGAWDRRSYMLIALAALRRGRELPFANRLSDFDLGIIARDEMASSNNWPDTIRSVLTALGIGAKP